MQRLILFDIDGTLLSTGGAGARALYRALLEVFGTAGPLENHDFAGKTDPQIAHELLSAAGFTEDEVTARLDALWRSYLQVLPEELACVHTEVFPGVFPLLERIEGRNGDAALGLLTGNLAEGARLKLDHAGIGFDRFVVGAFGSDHARRAELPAVAVHRAEQRFGHRFDGRSIVIIGDTPHDISCGAHLGVRTLAVATGSYSLEQLAACAPDFLFASLAEVEAVWEAIFAD